MNGLFSHNNLITMLTTGLPALIVALVSPVVTVRVALKQFYSQKWWEQKSEAYVGLIQFLSEYQHACGELFNHFALDIQNNKFKERMERDRSKAYEEIQKIHSKGQFVFPKAALFELKKFIDKVNKADSKEDFVGALDNQYGYAKECIEALNTIGRKDLRIR